MKATDVISHRLCIAPVLMMEAYERLCPNTFEGRQEPSVKRIARQAWDDAGYCIDAPDLLPAGGCTSIEIEKDLFAPAQIESTRL